MRSVSVHLNFWIVCLMITLCVSLPIYQEHTNDLKELLKQLDKVLKLIDDETEELRVLVGEELDSDYVSRQGYPIMLDKRLPPLPLDKRWKLQRRQSFLDDVNRILKSLDHGYEAKARKHLPPLPPFKRNIFGGNNEIHWSEKPKEIDVVSNTNDTVKPKYRNELEDKLAIYYKLMDILNSLEDQ